MPIYSYLNLPNFESNLEFDGHHDVITDMKLFNRTVRKLDIKDYNNNSMPPAEYVRKRADEKYHDYIIRLIPELQGQVKEVGFQKMTNATNHPNGSQLIPHTDMKRGDFCIHWIFSTGGDQVKTCWWQEKGHDLIRPPWTNKIDYSNLDLVDEMVWKPERWCIFRTDIIHSVTNIQTERTAFAVGVSGIIDVDGNDSLYMKIIEKYGLLL